MKRTTYLWSIIALTILPLPAAHAAGREASAVAKPQAVKAYGQLPLSFEANQGQTDQRVKFVSHGSGYSLFLTRDEAVLALKKPGGSTARDRQLKTAVPSTDQPTVLRMRLVGANAAAKVTGMAELPGKSNYFIGNDPTKWRTNVPNYAKVKYKNVYPGVDLVYYGNQRQLEYDFVVQPGADLKDIKLEFAGELMGEQAMPLRIDGNGDLVVGTDGDEVIFHKPTVYQPATVRGLRTKDAIDGKYLLKGGRVAFKIASYDKTRPLVIDPTLAYSTYLGGSGFDGGSGIAVDAAGNAYVTGTTSSRDFPVTPGAFQTTFGGVLGDAFVSKLNATGSALVYSTFLGGTKGPRNDVVTLGHAIAVDASGNAYITGLTTSSNFPTTPGAFQTGASGSPDAFVSKLDAAGSSLLYSTYLGGSGIDEAFGIALDSSSNAYVTGSTSSRDFPITPGAFQTTFNALITDAFISKLNATGSALLYSTYLGGSSGPAVQISGFNVSAGIAVDALGNAYVTGQTGCSDFPTTPGVFEPSLPDSSPAGNFVSKLNADGSGLLYSTYVGGTGVIGVGGAIAVDASGDAYITGYGQFIFPTTPGAFQTTFGGGNSDAFISKLNTTGSALIYSTFLGGSGDDFGSAIIVDTLGNAYVTGPTGSSNFPTTPGAFQTTFGGVVDAFVSKLNAAGSAPIYSTFLGGSGQEDLLSGAGIALDASGSAYITGGTASSNFPSTPGAFQTTLGGGSDAFVSKFSFGGIPFSCLRGRLDIDRDLDAFKLKARFNLGHGGSIDPVTQPVELIIGTYSVTIPAGSFVKHEGSYRFEGMIGGVHLDVVIKHCDDEDEGVVESAGTNASAKCRCQANGYKLTAEGRGANLKGTTNPVTVTLTIGNDMGTTQIHAEFE